MLDESLRQQNIEMAELAFSLGASFMSPSINIILYKYINTLIKMNKINEFEQYLSDTNQLITNEERIFFINHAISENDYHIVDYLA